MKPKGERLILCHYLVRWLSLFCMMAFRWGRTEAPGVVKRERRNLHSLPVTNNKWYCAKSLSPPTTTSSNLYCAHFSKQKYRHENKSLLRSLSVVFFPLRSLFLSSIHVGHVNQTFFSAFLTQQSLFDARERERERKRGRGKCITRWCNDEIEEEKRLLKKKYTAQ